jgi:hypothetical protein
VGSATLGIRPSEDLFTRKCYPNIVAPTRGSPPTIGFEFDLNYGASTEDPPRQPDDPRYVRMLETLDGANVTAHRTNAHKHRKADGFRLEGDGNRIEIATKPFPLNPAGRREMQEVIGKVLELVSDLQTGCNAAPPATRLGYPAKVGAPRCFRPPEPERGIACFFPLSLNPRTDPYFASGCVVAASPQATLQLPLASIDGFVTAIKASEQKWVAGRALSGPKGKRQGVRSVALYEARDAVTRSRDAHLKARTRLADGTTVSEKNFTPTLQGLLILLVSYLKSGELKYNTDDYEPYAKGYLPLNVKNPFRLLYADLTADERRVFTELYDRPRTRLWQLAKPGASASDGSTKLFPPRTHRHQGYWFADLPTWDDLIVKTIGNKPLLRNDYSTGMDKKGEDIGCEVLFAPLSRILPYETGSRRVTVEMRRLGHNYVFANPFDRRGVHHPGWVEMTETLFDLAAKMN